MQKILFLIALLVGIAMPAAAAPDYGSPKLNRIYKLLKAKKTYNKGSERVQLKGKVFYYQSAGRVYFLNKKGHLVEGPRDDIFALIQSENRETLESDSLQSDSNKGRGTPLQQSSREAKIFDQLKRNPGYYLRDPKNNKIYWLDDKGQLASGPLHQTPPFIASPGQGNENKQPEFKQPSHPREMICKDSQGLRFTPREKLISSSAQLTFPGGNCNGFRVSGNHIMTNAHCMEFAANKRAKRQCDRHLIVHRWGWWGKEVEETPRYRRCVDHVLRAQRGKSLGGRVKARFLVNGRRKTVTCKRIRAISQSLDYALLDCPGMPKQVPVTKIADQKPRRGESLTLATWDFKGRRVRSRIQRGKVRSTSRRHGDANQASTIVIPGNSGSVMYNSRGEAIGLANSSQWIPGRRRSTETTGFYALTDVLKDIDKQVKKDADKIRQTSKGVHMSCNQQGEEVDDSVAATIEQ